MWKNLKWRPMVLSALVFALMRGLVAAGLDAGESYYSPYNYAESMTYTVSGYGGATLTNFPVYVRIASDFDYSRLQNGTNDLTFFSSLGKVLPYEIEHWDETGASDSRLWLKMPFVREGETITMCWNLREGFTQPDTSDTASIWSDYVGVWHMDEDISSALAATTKSHDATGHGLDAMPMKGSAGDASVMISTEGVFGNARVNDTAVHRGSFLAVEDVNGQLNLGDTFAISLWLKVDGYGDTDDYPHIVTRRQISTSSDGYQIHLGGKNSRNSVSVRGQGDTAATLTATDKGFKEISDFTHLVFVYNGTMVTLYANGENKGSGAINAVTDVPGDRMGIGNRYDGTEWSLWGRYDEVRLYKGAMSAEWIAAEHAMGTNANFLTAGSVLTDSSAVLKNVWTEEPSITKTTWEDGDYPTKDDFMLGTAAHGDATIVYYNKTTGETIYDVPPKSVGEYRAIITVPQTTVTGGGGKMMWGALEYTIDFRIIKNSGKKAMGASVDRVLLMNDDYSIAGAEVEWQAYDDEDKTGGYPYWEHLDDSREEASTSEDEYWSVSPEFNLGGGVIHRYWYAGQCLWELKNVRVGNTFNNGEDIDDRGLWPEKDAQGLNPEQNYLPWSPNSERVLASAFSVGSYHRHAGQIVMQNVKGASVTSSMYTNGIGTIYFDAVNGWTNNTYGADGVANYQLVVEIATNTSYSSDAPTDALANSKVEREGREILYEVGEYADWQRIPVRVLYFDGTDCEDLGETNAIPLDVEAGGSYQRFFRIIAPVNIRKNVRFRIRRVAIDPEQSLSPDGSAYILVDNIICSTPADYVELAPYASALIPAFPSIGETVYGRAKATMANGGAVPSDAISSATMHYRWHYLEQKSTPWRKLDFDCTTLKTREPLDIPAFDGDIEFWFDVNQTGQYYSYVDYSGTSLKLGNSGYTEAITSKTYRNSPKDWSVRIREGKSNYAAVKLIVREGDDDDGSTERVYDLRVTDENLWCGYYRMTEALPDGIMWRIEARDLQEDGAADWQYNTNYWYVVDWSSEAPDYPAAGRMSAGGTNAWSWATCDAETGYLQFQVDESTLGVTVIHADHQDFNHWNDADTGYFNGSSSETNTMHGTSANVREYATSYAGLSDTPATNDLWELTFKNAKIGDADHPGYKMFAEKPEYYQAWNLGKGMWVYGGYREPNTHVAYQMAGCGEGYAEMAATGHIDNDWPRGYESVSIHTRIAQPISPAYSSYYKFGLGMRDYTFMTRVGFDMKANKGFTGSAALSLFAYYTPNEGAYEARWEQIGGDVTTSPAVYVGLPKAPTKRGQRLVISRWNWVGSDYRETVLFAATNSASFEFDMPTMSGTVTNNLLPFCISVVRDGNANVVVAGVRYKSGGVGPQATGLLSGTYWYFAVARDTASNRLRGGSYGVLSSNCEGLFLTPQIRNTVTYPSGTTPSTLTTGVYSKKAFNDTSEFTDCVEDMADEDWPAWSSNNGREQAFYDPIKKAKVNFGFAYVPPVQTIDVYLKDRAVAWAETDEPYKQIPVTSFGTPGENPDEIVTLYFPSDKKIRLRTGGELGGDRMDVVISQIIPRQWRGYTNWDETHTRSYHTNFVFTSGWVTNGAVQLSAKRTIPDTPCSLRSPVFDGDYDMGTGLGMFKFTYREPQTNIVLLLQVVTNVEGQAARGMTTRVDGWDTIAKLDYKALWSENESPLSSDGTKSWSYSFGWHGTKGVMRVIVDPELVNALSPVDKTDTTAFGSIDITSAYCTDEPGLDKGCWWGWNIQTGGSNGDAQKRMYLPDYDLTPTYGRWLALNNSITDSVDPSDRASGIDKHMPFVQSPTFTNALIGQVTFKARKYDLSDYSPNAKVVVYGVETDPDQKPKDSDWIYITDFEITNTLYTTYTIKTDGRNFRALRLAVVDVEGTQNPPSQPPKGAAAQRVLIDEVTVSEVVRAMLSFRNVGAFRSHLGATDNSYVPGLPCEEEQPLYKENWGIQAEVFATMLGDEIDKSFLPVVHLHWYVGKDKWGFANWKNVPIDGKQRGRAELKQTEGSNYVYRASYPAAPKAIMAAQNTPGTVVQYMLEVEYRTVNTTKGTTTLLPATNWLDSASWSVPSWFAPVDYNSDPNYGAGKSFAAFTILDNVAPHWAWINEMNILGTKDNGGNSDEKFQYVEVCAPMEADLTDWSIRFLDIGTYTDEVVTNRVATFGSSGWDTLSGLKNGMIGNAERKVFHVAGNKESDKLKKSNGTLDGVWAFSDYTNIFRERDGVDCVYDVEMPIGVQLVRASGVIENSVVIVGTNVWGVYMSEYNPTNIAKRLNRLVPGSSFYYASDDAAGTFHSASVTEGRGESAEVWAGDWACSPGRINTNFTGQVQKIDSEHPTPQGDSIIVYASVDTSFGHIWQSIGGRAPATNGTELIILKKGNLHGTNIVYTTDPWYEIASVKTNGVNQWTYVKHVRRYEAKGIGALAEDNVDVIATAQVDSNLSEKYGLTKNNPFTPAVMSWLLNGTDAYGNPFENASSGEIALADYMDMTGTIVTNLSLSQMYCLDMDPTVSNLIFKAGMLGAWPVDPEHHTASDHPIAYQDDGKFYAGHSSLTNVRTSVFMMISNTATAKAWSPYIMRGLDYDFTSWDYAQAPYSRSWTSETFKVTGILANGITRESNLANWIALRWFVFNEGSFDKNFTTWIEIVDPHSQESPGAAAGWYDWCQEHGYTPVFNRWSIDMNLKPVSVEVLSPTNYYPTTSNE